MVSLLFAAALATDDGDAFLGVALRDERGRLTTIVAAIRGASCRFITRRGEAWVAASTGWMGVKSSGKEALLQSVGSAPERVVHSFPVPPPGQRWAASWIEDGHAAFALLEDRRGVQIRDFSLASLGSGPPPAPSPECRRRLDEAFQELPDALRPTWSPLDTLPKEMGRYLFEGKVRWGFFLSPPGAPPSERQLVSAPEGREGASFWKSVKAKHWNALAAVEVEEWAFVLTPDSLILHEMSGRSLGTIKRQTIAAGTEIVGAWEAKGKPTDRESEFRKLPPLTLGEGD